MMSTAVMGQPVKDRQVSCVRFVNTVTELPEMRASCLHTGSLSDWRLVI